MAIFGLEDIQHLAKLNHQDTGPGWESTWGQRYPRGARIWTYEPMIPI